MRTFQKANLLINTCYIVYTCLASLKQSSTELSIQRLIVLHPLKDIFFSESFNGWMEKVPSCSMHIPGCWV